MITLKEGDIVISSWTLGNIMFFWLMDWNISISQSNSSLDWHIQRI